MSKISKPPLDLKTFVLLLFSVLVGGVTGGLTYLSHRSAPQALLAAGGAAGVAFLWGNSVIGSSDDED